MAIKYILTKHTILSATPIPDQTKEADKPNEEAKEEEKFPELPAGMGGEEFTGYEGPEGKGEFECENCKFFDGDTSSCGQKTMMAKSKRPRVAGSNRVIVHPEGCCEFVDRIGKKEEEDKD